MRDYALISHRYAMRYNHSAYGQDHQQRYSATARAPACKAQFCQRPAHQKCRNNQYAGHGDVFHLLFLGQWPARLCTLAGSLLFADAAALFFISQVSHLASVVLPSECQRLAGVGKVLLPFR